MQQLVYNTPTPVNQLHSNPCFVDKETSNMGSQTTLSCYQGNTVHVVGAAPNAIAYDSKQFTSGEFFKVGIPASVILLIILGLVVTILWPIMGMPITLGN